MISKCQFCDYQKESNFDDSILKKIAEPNIPVEDYMLFMERLVDKFGIKDWTSIKIHMGIKHKGKTFKYISPILILSDSERELINGGDEK
jgi:hypothetical protein